MMSITITDIKRGPPPSWLQERVAKLSGGVAVIKVGAATGVEMKGNKARVEDALHATRRSID